MWVCMLKIFQIGISCLGNSHKHQNNIMQKKTSIKINNYLPCSIKITCTARKSKKIFLLFYLPAAVVAVVTAFLLLLLLQSCCCCVAAKPCQKLTISYNPMSVPVF